MPYGSPRQVLLIELETLQELQLLPGVIKENITTQGLCLPELQRGSRLIAGSTVLTITGPCHPCARMEEIRHGLRSDPVERRGVPARVSAEGTIHVGDAITLQ